MAKDVNPPRGMRDFLPQEKALRDHVLNQILQTYKRYGFQSIETPALEDLERLTSGQGGDNEKLAFRVLKRGEELDRVLPSASDNPDSLADLGLRYDLTVPLTRYYATNHAKLPKVFKAVQTGPVWRAERPQKGRYRQFIQCDIDIIGDKSIAAEAELLIASLAALDEIGLSKARIRINHRELLARNILSLGVAVADSASAMITIDKLDKIAIDGVVKELDEKFGQGVAAKAQAWLSGIDASEVPAELKELFELVGEAAPDRLVFDPTLVRGMGYYTGSIFEIEHPESGSSIGGGGRYDGMVGRWLGADVPAVGISIGFERAVDLVGAFGQNEPGLVLVYEAEKLAHALKLQTLAIAEGWVTRLEQRPKNLKLLLETMASQGFTHFSLIDGSSGFQDLVIKVLD
jgi:histidyl-tRNA synthetase